MRQKFEIEIPDGGHLAKSRNEEGTYRGMILDDETNQIKGQATLIPVDDEDDASSDENPDPDLDSEMDPEDAVIGGLLVTIGVGAVFVAGKAAYDHWGGISRISSEGNSINHQKILTQRAQIAKSWKTRLLLSLAWITSRPTILTMLLALR